MKTNKKTYLIAALLLISLVSAIPIDPLPGSGQTQHTTSVPAQIPESTYPQLPLALFAAAAAALLIYQQAAKPRYITDGATYRIDSSGKLYLPTGGGWTEATFSSDAAYTQYLRTSVKSAAGDKVAVRGADGKWALASKSAVSSYLSMLDSSQSKLTQLQKDLPGARGRFFAAKRQSATSWMTRSAAAVYDRVLSSIDAAKSTISSLSSWLTDLTKLESSDKYGFKFSGRTYTYSSSGLVSIEAQSAYTRFKEDATASESSFTSELKTLFSGYSSHAAALGWSGVDLMKQRMKEIYQTHLSEIGAASQEFSVDYVKNGDWKHAEKKRSELSSETKDDMKVLYEKYLEKIDELAYDKLVSAEEKARIAAEEARLKQEEAWRAQSFWDRNGDKIRAKLKKDYVSSLAAAGKLRDSALKAYTGSVTTTYYDAFEKVGFLESHDRSGSEFDRYYLGYRSEVGDQQLVARDAKSLNRAADIMDALNKALAQGDVYLSNDVRYLQSYLSDVEESAGSQAYGWFKESLYTPWATQFEESWKTAAEAEKEKLKKQAEAAAVASQVAAGRAATADMIQKMQARDLLLKQFQDFGWGQYNPFNPTGVCEAPQTSLSSVGEESYLTDPRYIEAKGIYDFIDGIDRWTYTDLGGKLVVDLVGWSEGVAGDVGGAVWNPIKDLGEGIYDAAKPYVAATYSLMSLGQVSGDTASSYVDYWARLGGVFGQRILDDAAGLYDLGKFVTKTPVGWAKFAASISLAITPISIYVRDHPQEISQAIKSDLDSRIQLIQDTWGKIFSQLTDPFGQKYPMTVDGAIDEGAARGFGAFGLRPGDTDLLTSLFGIHDDLAGKRFDDATTKLAADTVFFTALSKLLGLGGKTTTAGGTAVEELSGRTLSEQVTYLKTLGWSDKQIATAIIENLGPKTTTGDVSVLESLLTDVKVISGSETMAGKPAYYASSWLEDVKISGKLSGVPAKDIYLVQAQPTGEALLSASGTGFFVPVEASSAEEAAAIAQNLGRVGFVSETALPKGIEAAGQFTVYKIPAGTALPAGLEASIGGTAPIAQFGTGGAAQIEIKGLNTKILTAWKVDTYMWVRS